MFFHPMWVINVTPDSFSDGGHWLYEQRLEQALKGLSKEIVIDVGAESTAPQNIAINAEEEIHRLDQFFFSVIKNVNQPMQVSFDTYKVETILWCLEKIKAYPQIEQCFWNDVSGHYLDQVTEILKSHPKLKYILCHNLVTKREETLKHSLKANEQLNIKNEMLQFFSKAHDYFMQNELSSRVIFDPAFGFAKTRIQNFEILEFFPKLISYFPQVDFLIGISRKSFLREVGKSIKDVGQLELAQIKEAMYYGELKKSIKVTKTINKEQKIYWRSHNLQLLNCEK